MPELFEIKQVEVFSAGKWNGDEYTKKDLDEMVRAFNENKDSVRPFLKLGHDEKQQILQNDGLPSAGWIDKLYIKGEKLLADFVDIPKKVFELIQRKAYRKVSSEVFWDIDIKGNKYKRMLGAVALLGADTPGVMNLSDILALYKNTGELKVYTDLQDGFTIKEYQLPIKEGHMPENSEIEKLKAQLADKNKELADSQGKVKELTDDGKETEKKFAETQEQLRVMEVDNTIIDLEKENLCTKAMKPYIREYLGEVKKVYTVQSEDKTKKEFSKGALLKEILKLNTAGNVNLEENSDNGKDEKKVKNLDGLDEKINKYSADHKVSYSVAYKAVVNDEEYMELEKRDRAEDE